MGLRDIVVTLLVFGSLPFIFRRPYIGILVWSWLSYMNPHKLSWGFAVNMPFAQIVAITLLISLLFSDERKSLKIDKTLIVWILFILWMLVTTILAIYPEPAMAQFSKVFKIQAVTFLTMMLITNQQKMNQLIWVIAVSIGYFSGKGGLFTIMTGGGSAVYGPPGGFIQENNSLALATLMVIPLMVYLYRIHKGVQWIRLGLGVVIFFSVISVVGSQSRGALIAIAAFAAIFWLKSKHKLVIGLMIVLMGASLYSFMPDSWHRRMESISNYQEDRSAMGRINAWKYSVNVANDRVTGGGFNSWSKRTYAIYSPSAVLNVVAHSIYFGILADHGWFGLGLFLLILYLTWRNLAEVIRSTERSSKYEQQNLLARMLQVSLIAYMSGGAFLSLSYFDLPWHIFAFAYLLKMQLKSSGDSTQKTAKQHRPKYHRRHAIPQES